ncbi:hypothetical protein BDW71DRAFT_178199 [Aspergillus fruticulosus]
MSFLTLFVSIPIKEMRTSPGHSLMENYRASNIRLPVGCPLSFYLVISLSFFHLRFRPS